MKFDAAANEIHVWQAKLNQPDDRIAKYLESLAPEERQRAGQFLFDIHKRRFISARGILRNILSRYLDTDPARIRLAYEAKGKPYLLDAGARNIQFNLSHSDDFVLYAIAPGNHVGIDLEVMRPVHDMEDVAKHSFSPNEYAALQRMPDDEKLAAFFNCWTRKEAYIKALGHGLSMPLDSFDVSLEPSEQSRLLHSFVRSQNDLSCSSSWSIYHWKPTPHSVAALASAAPAHDILLRDWVD